MSRKAHPLVSVIVPCYNQQNWLQETIESCLTQTYSNIEIIAIDDGSTDRSFEILQTFVPHIRVETGQHLGGNHARNKGFELSKGKYIQYLDSDDIIKYEKIARQVHFLEDTSCDVVFGDWRFKTHLPQSRLSYLSSINVAGPQKDILASLMSGWWVALASILFRRTVIENVGGWDEQLLAAQDRDFLTSVALSEARLCYQPGCYSVYRVRHTPTVSTSNLNRRMQAHCLTLKKSEDVLERTGRLTSEYKSALAFGYFDIARDCYKVEPRAAFSVYSAMLENIFKKIFSLHPRFSVKNETRPFVLLQSFVGFKRAAYIMLFVRSVIRLVKSCLRHTILLDLVLRFRGIKIDSPPESYQRINTT